MYKLILRKLNGTSMFTNRPILVSDSTINPNFIGFEEASSYWSPQFFFAFHWSPLIDKPGMTLISFVKTTKSYKVSLVTINRQSSYDPSLRLWDHTRSADESYEDCQLGRHLGSAFTGTGKPNHHIEPDCVGRAMLH